MKDKITGIPSPEQVEYLVEHWGQSRGLVQQSYREQFGLSYGTFYKHMHYVLKEILKQNAKTIDDARTDIEARYWKLYDVAVERNTVVAAASILEKISKLIGADAPLKVETKVDNTIELDWGIDSDE